MKNWIVVCRTGKEYALEHAEVQRRQFMKHARAGLERGWRFICLTDQPSEDWHVPLVTELPGWWALLEMFRFDGPNVLTGLDTVLIGDLDPLLQKAEFCPSDVLYGVRDFYYPQHWATGVTLWNGDWSALLKQHTCEDQKRFRGDQNYIEDAVLSGRVPGRLGYLQDDMPVKHIISFKADITRYRLVEPRTEWSSRVCCFHGFPRPWDIAENFPWVKDALTLPADAGNPNMRSHGPYSNVSETAN